LLCKIPIVFVGALEERKTDRGWALKLSSRTALARSIAGIAVKPGQRV